MKRESVCLLSFLCLLFEPSATARAQTDPWVEGAKKEERVVFYASMETPSAQRLVAHFEKKHPFIKVEAVRIGSEKMATRLVAEAQAHRVIADVVSQSGFDFYGVLQKGVFESYNSPERAAFPAEYRDDKGLWVISAATLNVIAFNTRRFPGLQIPKSFWDLAEAKWKGQLIMDENESKWMAGMMTYYGEAKVLDLLRKLADQDIQFRTGHSLIQTMVAAGERPVAVVAFANGVDRLKKEGAPIEWVTAEPVIGLTFGLALVKGAPHPNAARLFVDFVLSHEGQENMGVSGYFVPRSDVSSPILKEAPAKTKVIPLPMTLATRYNEYFQTYRKIMRLK
jgi:iron(III) transport system substrate-binding protein